MIEDNIFNQGTANNQNLNDGCYPPWYYAYLNGADVPGGFQDLDPNILNMIAVFAGAIVSSNIPFNLQNIIGNWLQLAGQYIETYNAQQQYFQAGPGRYYNPIYKNINNPFIPENEPSESGGSSLANTETGEENFASSFGSSSTSSQIVLEELSNEIKELRQEIEQLKRHK